MTRMQKKKESLQRKTVEIQKRQIELEERLRRIESEVKEIDVAEKVEICEKYHLSADELRAILKRIEDENKRLLKTKDEKLEV